MPLSPAYPCRCHLLETRTPKPLKKTTQKFCPTLGMPHLPARRSPETTNFLPLPQPSKTLSQNVFAHTTNQRTSARLWFGMCWTTWAGAQSEGWSHTFAPQGRAHMSLQACGVRGSTRNTASKQGRGRGEQGHAGPLTCLVLNSKA